MSGKSGLELLKDIRLNEELAATDVFILSTDSSQEAIVNAMQAGVTGYILKPLNFKILQQKLAAYLPNTEDSEKSDVTADKDDKTVSKADDAEPAVEPEVEAKAQKTEAASAATQE